MKLLWGYPGWGWKMYGLASFRSRKMWFIGFSKQLKQYADASQWVDPMKGETK